MKIRKQIKKILRKTKGSITNLDIKTKLRAKYPSENITQLEVSTVMNSNYAKWGLSYTTNGSYRTYSPIAIASTKATKPAVQVKKVTKTVLQKMIFTHKGRFNTYGWKRLDGTLAVYNGRPTSKGVQTNGLIKMKTSRGKVVQINPPGIEFICRDNCKFIKK